MCNLMKVVSESQIIRFTSTINRKEDPKQGTRSTATDEQILQSEKAPTKSKTMAELDQEMRSAMEGLAGDGGEAGVELEGGKAVAMKRGVRENMFRYI
jgi:hypothetical protein